MPLHHYGLPVGPHYKIMHDFYVAIMAPLGYKIAMDMSEYEYCGFAVEGSLPDFWLGGGRKEDGLQKYDGDIKGRVSPIHVAFKAESKEQVDEWYENAMKNGATDNGKPGIREEYRKDYYAAFILDPLGNNIELLHLA